MIQEPIRTAVAGLGRAGWTMHALSIQQRADYRLVAAIDRDATRRQEAQARFPECRVYAEWKDFLRDPNGAELVIIATQTHVHASMSIEALKSGLHVLVEKPMALNVREADRMLAAARKARRILTVHQSRRTDAVLHHLLAIMDSGILGRIFLLKNYRNRFARRNDWQTLRKYGGGSLNNTGAHTIDQCLVLLQSPVQDVWGDLQRCITAGDAEDHVKVMLRGKNGRVIDMEVTAACAVPLPQWMVYGTLGTLRLEGDAFLIRYLDPARLPKLKVLDATAVPDRAYGTVGGDRLEWQEKRVPAAPPEFEVDFYAKLFASIRHRKKLFVTPESVREQIRVSALARKGTPFV